jgi:hypothetical protein
MSAPWLHLPSPFPPPLVRTNEKGQVCSRAAAQVTHTLLHAGGPCATHTPERPVAHARHCPGMQVKVAKLQLPSRGFWSKLTCKKNSGLAALTVHLRPAGAMSGAGAGAALCNVGAPPCLPAGAGVRADLLQADALPPPHFLPVQASAATCASAWGPRACPCPAARSTTSSRSRWRATCCWRSRTA